MHPRRRGLRYRLQGNQQPHKRSSGNQKDEKQVPQLGVMPRTAINKVPTEAFPPQHYQTERSSSSFRRTSSRVLIPRDQSLRGVLGTQEKGRALLRKIN